MKLGRYKEYFKDKMISFGKWWLFVRFKFIFYFWEILVGFNFDIRFFVILIVICFYILYLEEENFCISVYNYYFMDLFFGKF